MKLILALVLLLFIAALFWLWTPDEPRKSLVAQYAQGPEDFLPVAGLQLHLRDSGPRDAPAVIMLHGLGGSLHSWEAWATALADQFRIIRYDLPGAGLTGPDPSDDYSTERDMQVLSALMDTLGLERASLIGHSMGGRLAWNFATRYPARTERLVLIAPDGFASPGFDYDTPAAVPLTLSIMQWIMPRPLLRMSLAPAYGDPRSMTEERLSRYHDLLRAPGVRRAFLERMRQTVLVDPVPVLKTLATPTLLLWGEQDAMIPITNAQDYLAALPNATLKALPGVGHLPQEEAAERTLPALRQFLTNGRVD